MICTLYAHHVGFEKITAIIREIYPDGKLSESANGTDHFADLTIKGGLFGSSKVIKVSYRQKPKPSYQIAEGDDSAFTNNLKGLYNYVASLPSSKPDVQALLLRKIQTLNCEFTVSEDKGETKEFKTLIERLALEFDAIIFAQPDTPISRSKGQHFLDKNLNLLIDGNGACEVETLKVQIETAHFDADQSVVTDEQRARKENSEAIIKAKGIKVNVNLPCIETEDEVVFRTAQEVATRVSVLSVVNYVAFNTIPPNVAIDYLKQHNLWEHATSKEKDFLLHPTAEKQTVETWKAEDIYVLMWALGKVNTLDFPENLCNLNDIADDDQPVGSDRDPHSFIDAATISRSPKEILDAADLYYRLDWACVDARLNMQEMKQVHPGVVYERHYALNWLISYQNAEWDDVSCDT
ncbi:DUF4272 domain-containing protein [uncultured Mucilaginibacter sp.]|uniref:DUF4272 domain-containing protein n=1 Tax=uncultured Mucilaginibacter sp. TaxID=797541 RepID=UPI0025E68DF6|nr:DUF4272 domain-containing protein [uncultured Mucilaginibacter sp.]